MELTNAGSGAQAGFSAIETLIALLLLVIGIGAMTTGFTDGHRVAHQIDRRQQAIASARDKVTELLARDYDAIATPTQPGEQTTAGVLVGEDHLNGISRQWVVEPDHPAPGLARVWVMTSWTRSGAIQTYQLAGLRSEGLTP